VQHDRAHERSIRSTAVSSSAAAASSSVEVRGRSVTARSSHVAAQGERPDRALWTVTARATGGAGNSTALVGTPETVAVAVADYYDLGVRILPARGHDLLEDAKEFGREVIPLVRAEVARQELAAAG
jgi:alkanesulfonate monooxygenase SsuD/methylene tetrahydromethanopterin reductase-like flavin-dependent oxidoreductase (luciferase family)